MDLTGCLPAPESSSPTFLGGAFMVLYVGPVWSPLPFGGELGSQSVGCLHQLWLRLRSAGQMLVRSPRFDQSRVTHGRDTGVSFIATHADGKICRAPGSSGGELTHGNVNAPRGRYRCVYSCIC